MSRGSSDPRVSVFLSHLSLYEQEREVEKDGTLKLRDGVLVSKLTQTTVSLRRAMGKIVGISAEKSDNLHWVPLLGTPWMLYQPTDQPLTLLLFAVDGVATFKVLSSVLKPIDGYSLYLNDTNEILVLKDQNRRYLTSRDTAKRTKNTERTPRK